MTAFFVIAALIAGNALYVAAEFSAVAVQRGRIAQLAEQGSRRAAAMLAVLEDGVALDRYIAACQIGITLTSLIAGAFGQATLAVALAPLLSDWFSVSPESGHAWAAVIVLVGLTVVQVVLGELVPKSLALQFPEKTGLLTFPLTRWSASALRGFIWLLNGSGFLLLKPFGVKPGGHQHVHSPEEIEILIAESQRSGALGRDMSERLRRGLRLSERTVRDLMVPRAEIHGLDVASSMDELLARIASSSYSRLVVYRGSLDHVLGAVSVKDVSARYAETSALPDLAELVRPLVTVADTVPAVDLVPLLQEKQSSKALVVDADGRVQGFVSIEDVLVEVFGEIEPDVDAPSPRGAS